MNSGLVKKIAAKSCSLDPVPASLLRYCIDDLLPIIKRVVAPILWNDLPIDIRSINDVNKFKCKLKTFLF